MFVFKAGVVGAGTMGAEIAYVIAAAGIPVVLCDRDDRLVERGLAAADATARAQLDRLVSTGRLDGAAADAQRSETIAMIAGCTGYGGLHDVDLVIEAVAEDLELKLTVFAELDAATPGRAILASNTSSLSIGELASATTRPERVLGLHFFQPAAVMRLVELVEGIETSTAAMAAAASFVAAIRKTVVRCADTPGFIVNRVLCAAAGELWRVQEERRLPIGAVDRAVVEAAAAPVGPFALADRVGLDTVLQVAEQLRDAYGERFHVHGRLRALVDSGEGFCGDGKDAADGSETAATGDLAERFTLRAFVEACLVLEGGVAGARDIDAALAAGAGLAPPPFARADAAGLSELLLRLERAEREWGEAFAPPVILRRLVAQGRLGAAAGQGFFPLPRPDTGEDGPVRLESRGEIAIAWLDNPPANTISAAMIDALRALWDRLERDGAVRVLVIASANASLFCTGADIKGLVAMEAADAGLMAERMHRLLLDMGGSRIVTVAAVGGLAYGGGCELAMAADVRIAAQSASFAQPEIKLGIIPGFGGTQRLPRLVGSSKALEMNLLGEPIDAIEAWEFGLVSEVVPDHDLHDAALGWARGLATRAPLAVAAIKRLTNGPDLEAGAVAEVAAFATVFGSADAGEGTTAFVEKRTPRFTGR